MPDDDPPTVRFAASARHRRWPAVVTAVSLSVTLLVGVAVLLLRQSPATAPVAAAGPAASSVAIPAGTGAPATALPGGGCPTADVLVAEYRREGTSPGRSGAVARSAVTCAGGFAVMKLHSPGDSESVSAIFSVGPPVRFREAGSGPICTDDPTSMPGSVVVPRAAAAALDCVTTAGGG